MRLEIGRALGRGIPVIPVTVNGASLPKKSSLPNDVQGLLDHQAATVTTVGFRNEMAGLARDISKLPDPNKPKRLTGVIALAMLLFGAFASIYFLHSTLRAWTETALGKIAGLVAPSAPQHAPVGQEWVLFGTTGADGAAYFVKLASINRFADRAAALVRHVVVDPSKPVYNGQILPEADYSEDLLVFSCKAPSFAISETTFFSKGGSILYNYKWNEPKDLDLDMGTPITPGAIGEGAQKVVCNPDFSNPYLNPSDFPKITFNFLSRSMSGDGDIYYATNPIDTARQLLWYKFDKDLDLAKTFAQGLFLSGSFGKARSSIQSVKIDCSAKQTSSPKTDYYDKDNNLIDIALTDKDPPTKIFESSPLAVLLHKQCAPSQ